MDPTTRVFDSARRCVRFYDGIRTSLNDTRPDWLEPMREALKAYDAQPKADSTDDTRLLHKLREPVDEGGFDGYYPDELHVAAANRIEELLRWLGTEREMHNAWRKRAEEAEQAHPPAPGPEPLYPCSECGKPCSKVQGGVICAECWDNVSPPKPAPAVAQEPPCPECAEAYKLANAEHTTPGFFYDKCNRHKKAAATPREAAPVAKVDSQKWDATRHPWEDGGAEEPREAGKEE